jgi:hypothetical protein
MNIKPLNTEINRTALAEKIVQTLSHKELYDFALYIMASNYDNDSSLFFEDWDRWNKEG